MIHRNCICLGLLLSLVTLISAKDLTIGTFELEVDLLYEEDFSTDLKGWKTEGRGKIWIEEEHLQMDASQVELTAWCPFKTDGNILITCTAYVLGPANANNINMFFMASAPDGEELSELDLKGAYKEYHRLPNYIMTFTGEYSRLRRNPGFKLISENRNVKALAEIEYRMAILLKDSRIRCFINDIPVHSYTDESRYRRGRVALRSWHTRLWWDDLRIYRVSGPEP